MMWFAYAYAYMCIYIYIIYTHMYAYVYIHIYIYIRMYIPVSVSLNCYSTPVKVCIVSPIKSVTNRDPAPGQARGLKQVKPILLEFLSFSLGAQRREIPMVFFQ